MSTVNAKIPAWQATTLNRLSQQGLLSGVNPAVIGAIDQAESGGNGGSINSSGYGGFFGLGANTHYGTSGMSVTTSQLQGTTVQAYAAQAQTAAAAYASYLQQANGNALRAETIYQQGGNSTGIGGEGVSVFQSLGLGPNSGTANGTVTGTGNSSGATSATNTLTSTSQPGAPGAVTIASTPIGNVNVPSQVIVRGAILFVGLFLVYAGIKALFMGGNGPTDIVVSGAKSAKEDAKKGALT